MLENARKQVTRATAPALLLAAPPEWRLVLELIVALTAQKEGDIGRVLPSIDHGRVKAFVSFWREIPDAPEWFGIVLDRLDETLTQKRANFPGMRLFGAGIEALLTKTAKLEIQQEEDPWEDPPAPDPITDDIETPSRLLPISATGPSGDSE